MRSHPSLAIFAIDPSRRARPHCALDLATASASRSASIHDDTEAMDVDFVAVVPSSEDLPAWKVVAGVPFPSHSDKSPRKHALLRSSAPLATTLLTNRKGRDPSESGSPPADHQPPRKRTRTSALLQPPIKPQRSPRIQSLPLRTSPSRLPRPTSLSLLPACTREPLPKQPEETFTYAFPTSSMPTVTVMPHSPLFDLISCLITPSSLNYPNVKLTMPLARRRKPFSGGTVLLRNVYKSVVYGLALKYSVTESVQVYQRASGNAAKSPFDVQDALLADRLRYHLTSQGEDINIIAFEIETMDSYPASALTQGDASFPNPIIPYERLVSFILLQRRLEGRIKTSRKGTERLTCRQPSRLAESCTID